MSEALWKKDIENRFASHTITTTTVNGVVTHELKDGGSASVKIVHGSDSARAMFALRRIMVGGEEILPRLTTTQRDALSISVEQLIFNTTTGAVEGYNGTEWEVIGGSEWQVRGSTSVQTTDATVTVIDEFTLDDNETYMVQISVVGTKSDGSERCGVIKSAVTYRDGGSATIQGTEKLTLEEYSDSNWGAHIAVSGNKVQATVQGLAATTVNWKCSMQFIEQ